MTSFLNIVLYVVIIILILFICDVLVAVERYFSTKADLNIKIADNIIKKQYEEKQLDYLDRVEATVSTLNVINILIDNEINQMVTTLSRLNQKYDVKRLDTDVKKISEKIFNGFKKDNGLITSQLIVTDEFIMQHIMDEVITRLLSVMKDYNNTIVINTYPTV
jgi:hypothetical protein